ncbi:hypothetical protein [Nocardia sp. NBC_01388]|uniref:hypothetical protein n=1 Tax=Nocardia sp. NBC_01388 TaxID=2903596 RepID=UPI003250F1E1
MTSQPTALWIEQLAASPGSAFSSGGCGDTACDFCREQSLPMPGPPTVGGLLGAVFSILRKVVRP